LKLPQGGGAMAVLIKKSSTIKGFKRLLLSNLLVVPNMADQYAKNWSGAIQPELEFFNL
jgi:hypothetical protein